MRGQGNRCWNGFFFIRGRFVFHPCILWSQTGSIANVLFLSNATTGVCSRLVRRLCIGQTDSNDAGITGKTRTKLRSHHALA